MHQKEIFSTQIEIQNQTLQHIGREIHDNIGQKLTLASLYTQQLAFENKAPNIKENIENISEIINNSLIELRQLSKSLTDDTIQSFEISELIEKECFKINSLHKCNVNFKPSVNRIDVPYELKVVLYRITQEFIQNSIKYASCTNIYVELSCNNKMLQLNLKDDGKGFDATIESSSGIGLKNMKKRASIIAATFILESNNKGTTVLVKIPFTNEKQYCNSR